MKRKWYFPIRWKLMVSLLLVVTAVVSVITFTMANLFHEDKKAYINDLTSVVALNTASECRSLIDGYGKRLQAYARIVSDESLSNRRRGVLVRGLFQDFPDLVSVIIYRGDEEIASAHDSRKLQDTGLTRDALARYNDENPLPLESIKSGEMFVENASLADSLPALRLAVGQPGGSGSVPIIVSAIIRLDELLRLSTRSGVFDIFLVDDSGRFIAHPDTALVTGRVSAELRPEAQTVHGEYSEGLTIEYDKDGIEIISGFAAVGLAGITAVTEIPKAAAYLASRSLLNRLLVVAFGLLALAALGGLTVARRITSPVERLSEATKEIGRGRFDAQVTIESKDEIGTLANSFNQMAFELKVREKALEEAHSQLIQSEKLAAFGELGAGIAHEVKNPLAGILGCAQLSLMKADEGTPLRKNLELIEKETRRCKSIIENLLKFARREKTALEPVEINKVVEEVITLVSHQMGLHQVKIENDLAPDLPVLRGNANQLQQVLMNLMLNAQHAMAGKPGMVKVTTSLLNPKRVEVRVSDTGPGIPKEHIGRLFEPFFTTKPRGKGTGLGLSVSFGIIRDHGGKIRPESEPGQGASFIITLPVPREGDIATQTDERETGGEQAASTA